MATMQGIRAAHTLIRGLWNLSAQKDQRMVDSATTWMTELKGVSDEELLLRIRAHQDDENEPTLRKLLRKPGQAAPTPDKPGVDGCVHCKASGVRVVVRWVSHGNKAPKMQDLVARCSCQAGDRRKAQGIEALADVEASWRQSCHTVDGPYVDPEPQHRIPPSQREAFLRRAEGRLAEVQALLPSASRSTQRSA